MSSVQNSFNLLFMMWNGNKCFYFALYFIRQKLILTATNDVIVINKNAGKIYKFCVLQVAFSH